MIPKPITTFVGRDDELGRLVAAIAHDSTQGMVTLVGAGGAGKTRLALESAHAVLAMYDGAVHFVDLADLPAGAPIALIVFERMGLLQHADSAPEQGIALALEESRGLLILDNCEHVAKSAAALCEYLLQWVALPHILCTSREALDVTGENVIAISTLPTLESIDQHGNGLSDSIEQIAGNCAVRLFCDRASAVQPGFAISQENASAISQLCSLLDGLPLAIELAAAQVRNFTPKEILTDLQQHGLGLLARPNSANIRHRTLENAVAWSSDLLEPRERILFRRLAIFGGGWTLDAARIVCCDELVPETQLLNLMGNLLDKSLLITEQIGPNSRCRMLRTIHHHAANALANSGEESSIARRHLDWVRDHSKEALAGMLGPDSLVWMRFLDQEAENYALAMRRFALNEPQRVSRIILNISQYWVRRQKLSELMEWASVLMTHPRIDEMPVVSARAHYVLGRTYGWMMRYFEAAEHYRKAIALARRADEPTLYNVARVSALHSIANSGSVDEAMEIARSLEAENYAPQEPWWIANYAILRGLLAMTRGDYPAALALLNQGVRSLRILGETYLLTIALYQLGAAAQLDGKDDAALAYLVEANENASKLGFQHLFLRTQLRLAEILSTHGEDEQAMATFTNALALMNSIGEQPSAHVLRSLAVIALERSACETAHFLYSATEVQSGPEHRLTLTGELQHKKRITEARAGLDPQHAARLAHRAASVSITEALLLALHHLQNPGSSSLQEAAPKLEVHIMGTFKVWVHGIPVADDAWKLQKARELLALLACEYENVRDEIEMLLWPDADGMQMRNSLNVALHSLRRTLGDPSCVEFRQNRYQLAPAGGLATDLADFRQKVSAARSLATYDQPQAIAYLERAAALIRGPLLADFGEGEWYLGLRARVLDEQVGALNLLGTLFLRQQKPENAADSYFRALQLEPLSEEACRGKMRAEAAKGDTVRALQTYQRLLTALRKELGVAPSEETQNLHTMLLAKLESKG